MNGSQPTSQKILAIGSPLSNLKELTSKISQFQKKAGPFDCCVILGDLFKPDSDGSELTPELDFVVPTYFQLGHHPLPPLVQGKVDKGQPEVVKNLIYLGKVGAFKTAAGVKIAFVGGGAHGNDANDLAVTDSDLEALYINPLLPRPSQAASASAPSLSASRAQVPFHQQGIDLLLLNDAPPQIYQHSASGSQLPPIVRESPTNLPTKISQLITQSRPRYMLWSTSNEKDQGGFWEREPFAWRTGPDGQEERFTRSVRLDRLGGEEVEGVKSKRKFYYAFTLPAQTSAIPPRPEGCTSNPYVASRDRGTKRQELEDQNFIFAQNKKVKTEQTPTGPVPTGYVCRICNEPGHWIQDCPQKGVKKEYVCKICGSKDHTIYECPEKGKDRPEGGKPPPGYICKICQGSDHFIRECPLKDSAPTKAGPPESYACKGCGIVGQHWHRECPTKPAKDKTSDVPELTAEDCWFCLSNPNLEKKLIVHIGDECYVAMAKGQLIPTSSKHPSSVVPGGGHLIIVPIGHIMTPKALGPDEALPLLNEIETVKTAITKTYKAFGAVPVFFDLTRYSKRGGHYHIQSIPVPEAKADHIEQTFNEIASSSGVEWEQNPEQAMKSIGSKQYFRVDLPNGKKLVHLIRAGSFNMQFGRMVLAHLLDLGDRLNWQNCPETSEIQYKDAGAFKKALGAHMH